MRTEHINHIILLDYATSWRRHPDLPEEAEYPQLTGQIQDPAKYQGLPLSARLIKRLRSLYSIQSRKWKNSRPLVLTNYLL